MALVDDDALDDREVGDGGVGINRVEGVQLPAAFVVAHELAEDEVFLRHFGNHVITRHSGAVHLDDEYLAFHEFRLHAVAQRHEGDEFIAGAVAALCGVFFNSGGDDGDINRFAGLHELGFRVAGPDDSAKRVADELRRTIGPGGILG